ncbi:hypothetical protein B0I37DRAFT_216246 [Chaetomium sp. MPI-CAGE-AT-0009]|nr:hypothetical protein B0I37DRAFT_216246 [Chaetomium sp. MPI-CAGE-AT-0009]
MSKTGGVCDGEGSKATISFLIFSLCSFLVSGLRGIGDGPRTIVTEKGGDAETDGQGGLHAGICTIAARCSRQDPGARRATGLFSVLSFSFLNECAFLFFFTPWGFTSGYRAVWGSWQELAKGHRTFPQQWGSGVKAREKTVLNVLVEMLLQKRLNFHTGPCHQFR